KYFVRHQSLLIKAIAYLQIILSEAYVLLNVNYKKQSSVIDQIKQLSTVKAVKSVYGIYDLLIIFESDNLQQVKGEIDEKLPLIDGVENMTTLISVS
ncbi:MAG TPA: Lrp/AsnC ligand binding domain-containing protein, partial [Nitrososphaeraceae archaeon]|nr:Lrp/AsnC ligand binding domain-containing protein [Nitrososphaeraceae archaeon]